MQIAVVVYEPGEAKALDDLFCEVAGVMVARGLRLAGTIQLNRAADGNASASMVLKDIVSSRAFDISVPAPVKAQSCSLDPAALEDVAGHVGAGIDATIDLVLINRFGKQEALGYGLRSVIEQTVSEEIPLLTALCSTHLESWTSFAGDDWIRLNLEKGAILSWCHHVTPMMDKVPSDACT
jgi:hypothetical protein